MFFAIYACYFFNALTIVLMILTALQGYFSFSVFHASHTTLSLLAMIIYLFTQTLVLFFFTGMGVNIRDYVKAHNLDQALYDENKKIKFVLFTPLMTNIFFFIVLFLSGGAVHRHIISSFFHGLLFLGWWFHYVSVLLKEVSAFQSTVRTVLLMIKKPIFYAKKKEGDPENV